MPAGNAGFVLRLSESLGLGAGFFTPAGIGSLKFGSDNIVTVNPQPGELYRPTTTGTQSPNRALLLDREILAGFLSVGLGYAPSKMVRVGASLAAGFADVSYRNVASLGPGFLDQEVVNDVRVQDLFIPRATVGATISPGEAVDLSATFIWNADIEADGYVDVTSNGIKGAPRRSCVADDPGTRCRIDGVRLEVPYQRFEIVLGARYVDRIDAGVLSNDPMENERWDIEIDGYWVNTGHVDDYTLTLYDLDPDAPVVPAVAFSSDPNANAPSGLPPVARLPHEWNDTFGVRVGGDYVIIPGMLAARAGVAYETRGVPVENMNLDYWPVSKLAVHVGATYRIGLFDLTVAYAHIFNETIDVAVGEGNLREVTAITPDQALVVNEGRYTSSIDVISLQGNYRF
jgi:long-chain fatty acid transport protein